MKVEMEGGSVTAQEARGVDGLYNFCLYGVLVVEICLGRSLLPSCRPHPELPGTIMLLGHIMDALASNAGHFHLEEYANFRR